MGTVLSLTSPQAYTTALNQACSVLAGGGVVIFPTDSVYGIACAAIPKNPAREKIFSIKDRPLTQTLPWLLAHTNELTRYGKDVPTELQQLAEVFWPGALTLVVDASQEVALEYQASDGTIALRVPAFPFVQELAECVGPLATTSANTHGKPPALSAQSLEPELIAAADLAIVSTEETLGVASTIVGYSNAKPAFYREGAISQQEIYEALS